MIKKYFNENPKATITPWFKHSSSFIKAIRYDKRAGTLYVEISSKTYSYQVGIDLADEFSRSTSWGKFYDNKIKNKHKQTIVTKPISKPIELAPNAPALPRGTKTETSSDISMKDVAEVAWGVADVAALFLIPELKPVTQLIAYGTRFGIDRYLEQKGLEKPFAFELAEDLMVGYGIYKDVEGVSLRAGKVAATLKTPYFSIGYKQGTAIAKATPTQIATGVGFGAKTWKNLIFEKETERILASATRETYIKDLSNLYTNKAAVPIQIFGTSSNTIVDQTMAQAMRANAAFKTQWATRKVGDMEKVLDFTIANAKHAPIIFGTAVSAYEIYQDLPKNKKKKQKKSKKPTKGTVIWDFAKGGVSVAKTIVDVSKSTNR